MNLKAPSRQLHGHIHVHVCPYFCLLEERKQICFGGTLKENDSTQLIMSLCQFDTTRQKMTVRIQNVKYQVHFHSLMSSNESLIISPRCLSLGIGAKKSVLWQSHSLLYRSYLPGDFLARLQPETEVRANIADCYQSFALTRQR